MKKKYSKIRILTKDILKETLYDKESMIINHIINII